jgi:hypothetical protein
MRVQNILLDSICNHFRIVHQLTPRVNKEGCRTPNVIGLWRFTVEARRGRNLEIRSYLQNLKARSKMTKASKFSPWHFPLFRQNFHSLVIVSVIAPSSLVGSPLSLGRGPRLECALNIPWNAAVVRTATQNECKSQFSSHDELRNYAINVILDVIEGVRHPTLFTLGYTPFLSCLSCSEMSFELTRAYSKYIEHP